MTLKAVITKCPCFLFHRAELRNREMTDLGVQALNVVLFALQLSLFCGGLLIAHRYGKLPAAVKSMQDHINLSALICFKHPVLYIFCPRKVSSTFAHFMHFRSVKTWLNLLHSTAIITKGAVSNNPHYANHPKSGCNIQWKGNKKTDMHLHSFRLNKRRRERERCLWGTSKRPAALCCHFSPVAFDTFSQLIISND